MTTLFTNTGRGFALSVITSVQRHLALFTTAPDETGAGGVEVVSGWYSRITVDPTDWLQQAGAINSTTMTVINQNALAFAIVAGAGETIRGWGLFDAASGGNLLAFGNITNGDGDPVAVTIPIGGTPSFAVGGLQMGIGAQTFIANPGIGNAIRIWAPDTFYGANQYVDFGNKVYRRNTDGTSGAVFNPAEWTLIADASGSPSWTTVVAADNVTTDIQVAPDTESYATMEVEIQQSGGAVLSTYRFTFACSSTGVGFHPVDIASDNPISTFTFSTLLSGGFIILRCAGTGAGTATQIRYRTLRTLTR